jgi:tetratricopeptide (TPR) repeat protein
VNGILVDEATQRATRRVIDFRDASSVEAKGKAAPIAVWEAVGAHSRFGVDIAHAARTELVGRERELTILREAFDRARHERVSQLVTLVGVPGLGKSRLVYELRRIAEDDEQLITWRQGHCLAYGDGITMWALGEIVKAQAGVLEGDAPDEVATKIRRAVEDALPDSTDAPWIETELLALVGQGVESELGGDRRGHAFAAWRAFLEALAEIRPLVLVIEDLHWADESMLDFVDELVEWVTDVPLLVVGTARPELLVRRPGWGGGKLNATTVALSPLSDEQTARLIGGLLGRPVLANEQRALIENAGGNPLYAEQFAELYVERGSTDDLPLPETLQGLIAARLDGLESDEKTLLQDAAVVGKVFWSSSLGREKDEAGTILHALERKGFVRRQRQSSLESESEYAFGHALVRDVAYGQIPRGDRAAKHGLVAEWIASLGRPEDHAEMLTYHWSAALELIQASGQSDPEVAVHVCRSSASAGDRAASLNAFMAAVSHYERAIGLTPEDDPQRSSLLFKRAEALFNAGDEVAAEELELARVALLASNDNRRAAEAEALIARLAWFRGSQQEVFAHLRSAQELVEGEEPSLSVARVLTWTARQHMLAGDLEVGLKRAESALAMAEQLGLVDLGIHALTTIGGAKEFLGDTTGRDDLERAVALGRSSGSVMTAGALNNLSVVFDSTDVARVHRLQQDALAEAERIGDGNLHRFARGNLVASDYLLGEWDAAVVEADAFIAECETSPHILEGPTRLFRGYIGLARGHTEAALEDFARALDHARQNPDEAQGMVPALVRNSWACLQVGRSDDARALFAEAIPIFEKHPHARPWTFPELAYDLNETTTAHRILGQLPPAPGHLAMLAVLEGAFEDAARLYAEAGVLLFEAEARLRAAEQLFAAGRRADGEVELERALAFYRPIGAVLFVERGERLLAREATG